ncbi:MSRB1 isoform 3 [Pan troglodytes]|uniref:Methionine-R-sulfoxide reductase B1 n=2 Tax=Pan troglodytes TaxID=9598 RepID=A0A6D2WHR9_PANTR|nr:MSRB1 isoform 3 [Pan troglodytes]
MSFCSFFGGEVFQNHFEPGVYVCAKCGYELFSSCSKYAHSSPWPAFTETIHADSVAKRPEHNRPEALKLQGLRGVYSRPVASARELPPQAIGRAWPSGANVGNRTGFLYGLQDKGVLWQVWQWVGPRVPERRPQAGAVPILNIQQLAEVCP